MAILAVFVHHALKVKMLWMGVDLFFILSGFLITGVLLKAKEQKLGTYFAQFYGRRARRILGPYILTLLVVGLLFGFAWTKYWYLYILLANFLLPLHILRPTAFDPLWSLAVEEQFYLFWPFATYFLTEKKLWRLGVGLVILAPVLRGVFHFHEHWAIYTLTPFRMDLLSLGAVLCLLYKNKRDLIERWGTKVGLICSLAGLAGLGVMARLGLSTYGNTRFANIAVYECSLLTCLGVILWALSGRGVGILRWRPLTYIGQISYTMYLIHLALLAFLTPHMSPVMAAVAGLAATILYATLSWYLFEARLLMRQGGKNAVPQTCAAGH
jgi:peptidoglycan/LPS O-acetylase OafA/YrhL